MGSDRVLFLLYLNIILNWPEDGRIRPKHVAKYNLIVIIASCRDVCCVLTVRITGIIQKKNLLSLLRWIRRDMNRYHRTG